MSTKAKISPKQLDHIAHLARIKLTPADKKTFQHQLSSILDYIAILNKSDTDHTPPTFQVNDSQNVFRCDKVSPGLSLKQVLASAPRHRSGYILTPQTISK